MDGLDFTAIYVPYEGDGRELESLAQGVSRVRVVRANHDIGLDIAERLGASGMVICLLDYRY